MGTARRTVVVGVGAVVLALAGCGGGAGEAPPAPAAPTAVISTPGAPTAVASQQGTPPQATATAATPSPTTRGGTPSAAASTQLTSSGWALAGVPTSRPWYPAWTRFQMVADGRGEVWTLGPWQLVRLDPESGRARVWDAADDVQFASTRMTLAPARRSGVWLLDGGRARLFDGRRFAVDLRVPDALVQAAGGPGSRVWLTDLVEVGSEVWVSVVDALDVEGAPSGCCAPQPGIDGRVARFAGGRWEAMSGPSDGVWGYLAVEAGGGVWVGSRRWDGRAWSTPATADPDAPTQPGEVAADPTGGVWFVNGADGLRHFDGVDWRTPPPDPQPAVDESWTWGGRKLVVASDGTAWAAVAGLTRAPPAGPLHAFGRKDGVPDVTGLAIGRGDGVVVADYPRVLRESGGGFVPVWAGQSTVGWPAQGLSVVARSADEAWVNAEDAWYRYAQGRWQRLGAGSSCATVASDGAVWTTVLDGSQPYPGGGQLVRIDGAGRRSAPGGAVFCGYGASLAPGPHGSVWALQGDEVIRVLPDGTQRSIGAPRRVDPAPEDFLPEYADKLCLHGVDPTGAVWVSEFADADEQECTAGTWHRWDGRRWRVAKQPDPFTSALEHVVTRDGAGWVLRGPHAANEIARFVDGSLVGVAARPRLAGLTAATGGRACALEYASRGTDPLAILCVGPDGERARVDLAGVATFDSRFSVAPDGSIWLLGPQVARLPQRLPPP